jgi:hypothetical protein
LFDSLNGGTLRPHIGKPLRGGVTQSSPHLNFWKESIENLKAMSFEGSKPPSLKNFIVTLEGFINIHEKLLVLNFFLPRAFNQDSLEIYFGKIRKQRGRNVNPTCQQFTESYKTLLVQEIVASPRGGNCERTNLTNICSLKSLLNQPLPKNQNFNNNETEIINFNVVKQVSSLKEIYFRKNLNVDVISYISGWVAKIIKHLCSDCKSQIFRNHLNYSDVDVLTYEKEFGGKIPYRLKYCSLVFINCINKTYKITKILLNHMNGTRGNRQFIIRFLKTRVSFPFFCSDNSYLHN